MTAPRPTPELSILMPARNADRFIGRAIESTLRAMPENSELLVFDDASADLTAELLASIEDPRLRVFRGDAGPLGVARALNLLLLQAKGSTVARMDADDVCLPWRFSLQLRYARAGVATFASAIVIDAADRWVGFRPMFPQSDKSFQIQLLRRNFLIHPTFVGPRATVERAGGYRDVGAEDYDLWLRLAVEAQKFRCIVTPVLLYRRHRAQITSSESSRTWVDNPELGESWRALRDVVFPAGSMQERDFYWGASLRDHRARPEFQREIEWAMKHWLSPGESSARVAAYRLERVRHRIAMIRGRA